MKPIQPSQHDAVYSQPLDKVSDFAFDANVVNVFPDMINRSVPGYANIIHTIGRLAERYVQANTKVYDLGCSLGAASLAVKQHCHQPGVEIIGIDNSSAMVDRCQTYVDAYRGETPVQIICADINEFELEPCSMVILNFTLQFVEPKLRQELINRIFAQLSTNGLLVLSEKIRHDNPLADELMIDLHHQFKRDNGYSELEVSQKRAALENVMRIDTQAIHEQRLRDAGFSTVQNWFRCFNFTSWVAIKGQTDE